MIPEILTDERLDQIEARAAERWGAVSRKDAVALIAEVRRLRGKFQEAADWIKAANHFAWAHEKDCPRGNGGVDCTCGLHDFMSRPRPIIEGFKQEIERLRREIEASPHGSICLSGWDSNECDCWKSKAVAK